MSLGLGVGYYSLGGEDMASAVSTDLKQATSGTAAGLRLWLKNDTGVTAAKWTDSSGNDNHAAQSTEGNQASVSGGGLHFDGSNDHYDLQSRITIAENGGFCLAVVVELDAATNNGLLGDGNNEQFKFVSGTEFFFKSNDDTTTSTTFVFESNTFPTATKMLVLLNRSAGASNRFTFFKNGTQLTPNTDTSTNEAAGENPYGFDIFRLGSSPDSSHFFDGKVYELAFWNRSLTSQEITDVNSYLQSIHGL